MRAQIDLVRPVAAAAALALALGALCPAASARPPSARGRAAAKRAAADKRSPLELTASEAVARLASGRLTSEAYVRAALARADETEALDAFISRDADAAIAAARASDARRKAGAPKGRLDGLPIVVKDNIDSADLPTTGGTPGLAANRPAANAAVLQRLLDAGAILIGKTNMHELAFGATSNNVAFGAVHNPYDTTKIPGGSSGGTAAAIAARVVPVGLGTDTAGSVRVPAALSGTVGFRPSAGRYSRDGTILISQTQDRVGTLARSVKDVVLLDGVLSEVGSDVRRVPLLGVRLGVDRANFVTGVDPEVEAVFDAALDDLRRKGAEIVDVSVMPAADFQATIGMLRFSVGFHEAPANLAAYLAKADPSLTVAGLAAQVASPDVRQIFYGFLVPGAPMAVTDDQYRAGLAARDRLRAAYQATVTDNRLDGVIFPTTVVPAHPIGEELIADPSGNTVPATVLYSRNVVPAAYAGLAGLSLPAGTTAAGLPVGVEIDGLEGTDERVLGIGLAVEKVLKPLPPPALP